jgi:hypothetical protein
VVRGIRCFLVGLVVLAAPAAAQEKYTDADKLKLGAIQPGINKAIDRGTDWLIRMQNRDGTWSTHQGPASHRNYVQGITGLCTYTLLKSGLPPDHPSVKRALIYLRQLVPRYTKDPMLVVNTYDAGCILMAFEATHDPAYREVMQSVLKELLSWHTTAGIWTYGKGGGGDLSNTQYAALGLRAAELAGLNVPPATYKKLAEGTLKHQKPYEIKDPPADAAPDPKQGTKTVAGARRKIEVSGFSYTTASDATHAMTAAGAAIQAICRQGLERDGQLSPKLKDDLTRSQDAGVHWLREKFVVNGNYYYLYGLERVGSILEIDYFGTHPWYFEGADFIVKHQGADGSWGGDEANTCFAILFLRRATRVVTGGGVDSKAAAKKYDSAADSEVLLHADGEQPLNVCVNGFHDAVLKAYGSGGTVGGLRVSRVEYTVDEKVVQTVRGDPSKPWRKGLTYPAKLEFSRRGTYKVGAKVHLVAPDAAVAEKESTIAVSAKEVSVPVVNIFEEWMARAAEARRRNLAIGQKVTAKATSTAVPTARNADGGITKIGTEPEKAVDGLQSTYWACAANDQNPTISLEFAKPVMTFTIGLGQLNRRLVDGSNFDKIKKVEIRMNGVPSTLKAALEADDQAATYIVLPQPVAIQKLEIKILEREPGKAFKGQAGFTEVVLEANPR